MDEDDEQLDEEGENEDNGGEFEVAADEDEGGALSITDIERSDYEARRRAVDIVAGTNFIGRRFTYSVRGGAPPLPDFTGPPGPGVFVTGEIYPMRFDRKNRSWLRNIGVRVLFDQGIGISKELAQQGMPPTQLSIARRRLGAGISYRYNIGNDPFGTTLKAHFGVSQHSFNVAGPQGSPIPNVGYLYMDPGGSIRFPISKSVAIAADARFLLVLDSGQIQQADQFGPAVVTGFNADVHGEYKITSSIALRLGASLEMFGFAFRGGAAKSDGLDGDLSTQDVVGARDMYYGGYAVAGYQF